MRLNVAPETFPPVQETLLYNIYLSVMPLLKTVWLDRIICVCAYIIMHAFVLLCVHVCMFAFSEPLWDSLTHSCWCLSGSLSVLFLPPGFLKRRQRRLSCIWAPKWCFVSKMRRSYRAFPGAVTVTRSPCSAAPTPRTKQPY